MDALRPDRPLAGGRQPDHDRHPRLVADRQRADGVARAALPALGRVARRAGRHRHPRRSDLAGRLVGAQRRRAQRGGRADDEDRRTGAPLSGCPHRVFSGGSPALFVSEAPEAEFAARLLRDFGIDPERIQIEEQSRNTVENAVFSRLIAQPKPGERWLLVTSAYHMPRSIGAFRKAGFAVEPYPVDWRTRGPADLLAPVWRRWAMACGERIRRCGNGSGSRPTGSPDAHRNCFRASK